MSSSEAESRGCTTQSGGSFRFRKPQSVRPESHRHSGAIGKPHDRPRGPLQDYGARDLGGHDAVPSSTANGRASRGALYERARCLHGRELNQTEAEEPLQPPNPWTLHQDLKKGQAILISQAWDQHVADRKKVSTTSRKLLDVMEAEWQDEMQKAQNEVMLVSMEFPNPLISEIYTSSKNVMQEAQRRGHGVGTAMSLENGWT